MGAATGGVQNLSASAPGANRLVMSPASSQYLDKGWLSSDFLKYYFESAEQTITGAGALITCAWAWIEEAVQAMLICKTAEGGYSIGTKQYGAIIRLTV